MTGWRRPQELEERVARRLADFRAFAGRGTSDRRLRPVLLIAGMALLLGLLIAESRSSTLQSVVFSQWARMMRFQVADGPSPAVRFPEHGPFDERLGYTRLPDSIASLTDKRYIVERQVRVSGALQGFQRWGGFPPYQEKMSAGLTLAADDGRPYFKISQPENAYGSFNAVPDIIVKSLLFVENRELLNLHHPRRNPAVEWDRLGLALLKFGNRGVGGSSPGGSTVATQMEKLRHSPGGRTIDAGEKFRQMVSASLRAYRYGANTIGAREQVIVDALNLMPLAAFSDHGEVIGLGDGLKIWFGADFDEVSKLLRAPGRDGNDLPKSALALKQALSLIIAQRRPSYFLRQGRGELEALTDSYLRLMALSGVIDSRLSKEAIGTRLRFNDKPPALKGTPSAMTKAATAMRVELLHLLGRTTFYELDRLDLTAETTLDAKAQKRATAMLRSLAEPERVAALGLRGPRLLNSAEPAKIIYSFTLYERGANANHLRVQTDSLDEPLDINVGTKLELGSTAKVRTLITYLNIIADLHDSYRKLPPASLAAIKAKGDPLTAWVAGQLMENGDQDISALLHGAMNRDYSASPGERFFTAGGLHRFSNFDRRHGGYMSVADALRQSVNLVFIRIMRDIVDYQIARIPGTQGILDDPSHPRRQDYLRRFADMEGRQYLAGFYGQYRGLEPASILQHVAERAKFLRPRLAAAYRTVLPEVRYQKFAGLINRWANTAVPEEASMQRLYETYAPDRLSLADRSYVASIHPLELWLAGYLYEHPGARWSDMVAASADVRQLSYSWLFRPNRVAAQNKRIRILLEQQAFVPIHKDWQKLGYPFERLIPSYATAIGTSGDRPDALAELMGIIVSGGFRYPVVRIQRLRFAEGTPYETVLKAAPAEGKQVVRPEIATVVRQALIDVVEHGTARRANGTITAPDGSPIQIGGKTGTGDNRSRRFAPGRRLIESVARSRTATFAFFVGDRFFGTVTAHVDGPEAAEYNFTSALPTQLFKLLAPVMEPMIVAKPVTDRSSAVQQAHVDRIASMDPVRKDLR